MIRCMMIILAKLKIGTQIMTSLNMMMMTLTMMMMMTAMMMMTMMVNVMTMMNLAVSSNMLASVCAVEKLPIEQLNSDHSKYELEIVT